MIDDLAHWTPRKRPEKRVLDGRLVRLEPLSASRHGDDLYIAATEGDADRRHAYLGTSKPESRAAFEAWLESAENHTDSIYWSVIDKASGKAVGRQSLMRIDTANGVIEIGDIHWGPAMRRSPLATEAFVFGRMPLAFSARCFTARAANRPKDDCGFVCGAHPDGLTLHSRERQPFLALNGIQTQSAAVQNLLPHLPRLRTAGVDVLRLSPQSRDFLDVVRAFDDARQARNGPGLPDTFLSGGYCDGYLDGRAGMERAASAAAATAPP